MTPDRVDAYLERIAHRGSRAPTLDTVVELHRAHLVAVPFENLDITLGRPIALDERSLFEKIVTRRRGGFCYELNGLFAALLTSLGYRVTLLSAGVFGGERFSPEFDHLALRVDLEHSFLVDVGFGDSFERPVRFDDDHAHLEGRRAYRVGAQGDRRVLEVREEMPWEPSYSLSPEPRALEAFTARCAYHQTSPDSHFTRGRICSSLLEGGGRVSLSDKRIVTTVDGERAEIELTGEDAFPAALAEHFGISTA